MEKRSVLKLKMVAVMMETKFLGMAVIIIVKFRNILLAEEFLLIVLFRVEMEYGMSMHLRIATMEKKKIKIKILLKMVA